MEICFTPKPRSIHQTLLNRHSSASLASSQDVLGLVVSHFDFRSLIFRLILQFFPPSSLQGELPCSPSTCSCTRASSGTLIRFCTQPPPCCSSSSPDHCCRRCVAPLQTSWCVRGPSFDYSGFSEFEGAMSWRPIKSDFTEEPFSNNFFKQVATIRKAMCDSEAEKCEENEKVFLSANWSCSNQIRKVKKNSFVVCFLNEILSIFKTLQSNI